MKGVIDLDPSRPEINFSTGGDVIAHLRFEPGTGTIVIAPAGDDVRLAAASIDNGEEIRVTTVDGPAPGSVALSSPGSWRIDLELVDIELNWFRARIKHEGKVVQEFVTHLDLIGTHLHEHMDALVNS